jgi:hypothetical protein
MWLLQNLTPIYQTIFYNQASTPSFEINIALLVWDGGENQAKMLKSFLMQIFLICNES